MVSSVRNTAAVRAGWGALLLCVPGRYLPGGPGAVAAARVLGVRHLLQAATTALAPSGSVAGLGAVVDTLHAGSVLALAAASPRWRRAALQDAPVEICFAAVGWLAAERPRR